MDHYEMILKCTAGLYTGRFFYLNSNEPEIIGSGSFEELGVTASLQDSSLEPIHTKIQFKSDYFISDLSQSGTWMRIPVGSTYRILNPSQIRFQKSVFSVSHLSVEPPTLTLNSGRNSITLTDHCSISSKKPSDYILPSFEQFSTTINFEKEDFVLKVNSGEVYFKITEEAILNPGDEILIGSLSFEVFRYNYGKWATIGLRACMEDSDQTIQDLRILSEPVSYYAIFDGHGGKQCSEFLKDNLHDFIKKELKDCYDITNWQTRLSEAFAECDSAFAQSFPELSKHVGSAAIICMIWKTSLVIINCGDCRAVLARGGQSIQLSTDHKPDLPSERSRIERSGGSVINGRVLGKLGLSRAFGDFEYKPSKIVTCEPEVEIFNLDQQVDEFVVLGCDGFFEAYSNQEGVFSIRNRLRRMKVTEQDPNRVIKDVITEGVHMRRTFDNVSAILITFSAGIA